MMLQTKVILFKDVLAEAKKMNPSSNLVGQVNFYSEVQVKILRFCSDFDKSDIAFAKNQLAHLITDAFVPDYNWQSKQFNFETN